MLGADPGCLADLSGVLVEVASCSDEGTGVVRALPPEPGGPDAWTLVGAERAPDGLGLELLPAPTPGPARVFRSAAADQLPACVIVVTDASAREACAEGGGTLLAGHPTNRSIVDYDMDCRHGGGDHARRCSNPRRQRMH